MVFRHFSPIHLASHESKTLDVVAMAIVWVTFIVTLPQIIQIFESQSANDVSIFTWTGYTFIGVFWLFYGIERGLKPIIMSSLLHLVADGIMVYGIILYGQTLL